MEIRYKLCWTWTQNTDLLWNRLKNSRTHDPFVIKDPFAVKIVKSDRKNMQKYKLVV